MEKLIIYKHNRASASSYIEYIQDLSNNGNEMVLTKLKGLFYSSNKGISWHKRN
jgi:hypothetical protein